MAEINIERKKTPIWRWLIILLLLALIAWAVYEFAFDRNEVELDEVEEVEEVPGSGMKVEKPAYAIPV